MFGFTNAGHLSPSPAPVEVLMSTPSNMKYQATATGERVTQIYLDQLTDSMLRTGLRRAVRRMVRGNGPVTSFGLLHLAVTTPDFHSLWAKGSDLEPNSMAWLKANAHEEEFLVEPGYAEAMIGDVKSAWMVEEWMEETSLKKMEKGLDITPGDLHHRVDLMGWLLTGAQHVLLTDDVFAEEHASVIADLVKQISSTQQRVRHGCKEDLLQLVNIRHVGRQRARVFADHGVRTPQQVLSMERRTRQALLSVRGWGPLLLDKIEGEVERVVRPTAKAPQKRHWDDTPLDGERHEND